MEFDIAGLGIHNVDAVRLSMEFDIVERRHHCDASLSMEFDIVDKSRRRANLLGRMLMEVRTVGRWSSTLLNSGRRLHSDYVTCRWSSTLLTDMETSELPWTDVKEVRPNRTSYSWSMEFDIVELWKTGA